MSEGLSQHGKEREKGKEDTQMSSPPASPPLPTPSALERVHFHEESEKFLCDVLLPNLVWHAGRTAAAVRTSALSCLLALLHGGAITPGQGLISIGSKHRM
ncbi:dynein assembly factor 5, axonemal [Lates japonicus]|uniref:Dynein assembly factor 5, axonemal n=1 Tax=Lates japonicus TaxID=270547 RepID=A0AAD3NIW4_LATJO|nr:dynein assembly factor 5, axonemal [Lates japonicus]